MIRREKVKDIVEVRTFTHLNDFAADPGLTIGSYHFTDVTSDLMGKWIDAIADVRPGRGEALALAGLRGVGKSHFLAVLAAIASRAELRSKVRDPHIISSLERLPKRSSQVAFVGRGSGSSLMSELRSAIAGVLSINQKELSDSLTDVLIKASDLSTDNSLSIFIDTAFGREARVDRDDGALLSEIAETARNLGMFVGIALDDDVSGADGPNSSIARSYQIHFLDQEHLYRIVDRHIFPKNDAMLPVLKDIYAGYQSEIPGFKWSEQRFVPLYPLHPATLEIAPLIRLFVQNFTLLGFASEAAIKIMGRPADSLIGLDEMFSSVESRLRKNLQLKSAFRVFDKLDREVVQKAPVQFRLKAKLILKGLFLLSLNGQGASAATIAASMMVFDGQDPRAGLEQAENLLDRFATDFPADVSKTQDKVATTKFCLRIGIDDDLDQAIGALLPNVSEDDVWSALVHQLSDAFPEIQNEEGNASTSHVTVEWRGAMRRGEIFWQSNGQSLEKTSDSLDWEIRLLRPEAIGEPKSSSINCSLTWVAAQLTPEERDTVARFVILRGNPELKLRFMDGSATTTHLLSASMHKVCERVFFDSAALYLNDRKFSLSYELGSTHNLSHFFTTALTPVFEHLYPSHPYFLHPLGMKEVFQLTANFFGRADIFGRSIQNLAQLLAEPLGLTENNSDGYLPASADLLVELPLVKDAFSDWDGEGHLGLSKLASRFKSAPHGLTREAQQLILIAMVAQREIEFVTAIENRITFRSLDLQIIWDDVTGVSRPAEEKYSEAELASWFTTLTGEKSIGPFDVDQSGSTVNASLQKWLTDWTNGQVLECYEGLPDEGLNASSWRTATSIRKSLGSVGDFIESYTDGSVPIQECLVSIADLFVGSAAEFNKKTSDLKVLDEFTSRSRSLQRMSEYLADSDLTDDRQVERARQVLIDVMGRSSFDSSIDSSSLNSAWERFHRQYKDFYLLQHQSIFAIDRPGILKNLSESKQWQEFELYSRLSVFDRKSKEKVQTLFQKYRNLICQFAVSECLETLPYCFCGLGIADMRSISQAPNEIRDAIECGLAAILRDVDEKSSTRVLTNEDSVIMRSASLAGIAE